MRLCGKSRVIAGTLSLPVFVAGVFALAPVAVHASTGAPRPNSPCARVNQVVTTAGMSLRCELTAKGRKVWRLGQTQNWTVDHARRLVSPLATLANPSTTQVTGGSGAKAPREKIDAALARLSLTETSETLPPSTSPSPALGTDTTGTQSAAVGSSSYVVTPDPDNGGSPEVVEVDPVTTEQPNPSLPARVSAFEIRALGENSATFAFKPVTGVDQYHVYVRYGDSFTVKGATGTDPTVTFTDLTPDWSYTACAYYFVNSSESEKSCLDFRTLGTRPTPLVPVAGPLDVSATATENTITVSWSAVSGASWYSICHVRQDSMQCGGYTMLSDTSAIFRDGSIFPGWRYTVKVQAVFEDGTRSRESQTSVMSLGSQPAAKTKLAAPTNFRVVSVTPTTATVRWEYEDSSAISVWSVVARHLTSYSSTGADASAREFTVTNLSPGLGYEITLQGRTGDNETEVASTSVLIPRD